MKKLGILCLLFCMGCTAPAQPTPNETKKELPEKKVPTSTLIADSPITSLNIDDYLFIDDVLYIDLRDPQQLVTEGTIGGFVNVPFYGVIADLAQNDGVLFTMTKMRDETGTITAQLGDPGSFIANYEESESHLNYLLPQDKQIVFMSTAGVEATYMMNLLVQIGYDASLLYNGGSFSNSFGKQIAYRNYEDAQYYTKGNEAYTLTATYDWGELTPIPYE